MTDADLIAYLRSRPLDRRMAEAAGRLEALQSVAQMVIDTATVETPAELLRAAREALGE